MCVCYQAREELRPVRDDFDAKNKQLLDEMPKFYHSRIDYFQPSFEALIRAQVRKKRKEKDPGYFSRVWGRSLVTGQRARAVFY